MNFINIPNDLDEKIKNAIDYFWKTRKGQISKQELLGNADHGNRGAVTGGKQLDGFVNLMYELLALNGVPEECIFTNHNLGLPGYFRPNKKWDLLVVDEDQLIIAVEFKSQVGPSFGNNFNNRTEEAMGSALDLWTAYRKGIFGESPAPWLGYFMILEDCKKSNEPVHVRSPHFKVPEEFIDASYKERYEIFCGKLLLERQYNAACFAVTAYNDNKAVYSFPKEHLSFLTFTYSMLSAALAHLYKRGC